MNSPLVHKSLLQSHLQCSHFPLECQRVAENIPAINKGDIIVETGQGRKGQELNLKKKPSYLYLALYCCCLSTNSHIATERWVGFVVVIEVIGIRKICVVGKATTLQLQKLEEKMLHQMLEVHRSH